MTLCLYQIPNTKSIQIAKFIGGENSGIELEPDKRGTFVTSLDVGTIMKDSADKYECSPGPGNTAVARVHVITEGEFSAVVNHKEKKHQYFMLLWWFTVSENIFKYREFFNFHI